MPMAFACLTWAKTALAAAVASWVRGLAGTTISMMTALPILVAEITRGVLVHDDDRHRLGRGGRLDLVLEGGEHLFGGEAGGVVVVGRGVGLDRARGCVGNPGVKADDGDLAAHRFLQLVEHGLGVQGCQRDSVCQNWCCSPLDTMGMERRPVRHGDADV